MQKSLNGSTYNNAQKDFFMQIRRRNVKHVVFIVPYSTFFVKRLLYYINIIFT